jgi:hypothetical protein
MAQRETDPKMDASSLYREEIITDRKIGTLRIMTPLTTTGATDPARPVLYMGEAQIMTSAGPLPISFEIDAKTLADAVDAFGPAAKDAIEKTVKDLQELRRQAASSIVVPQGGMGGLGPGGLGGGGLGGGGKIQLP